MVHISVTIEIDEEKHGGLVVKMDGNEIGDLNIDPLYELNSIKDMMRVRMHSAGKIVEDLNNEIIRRLALLLAWYLTE